MKYSIMASTKFIHEAINILKKDQRVSAEACFNEKSDKGYRKEIAYRDVDFLYRLGNILDEEYADYIIEQLIKNKIVPESSAYNKEGFLQFRKLVKENFVIPWTTITPVMERLLYFLASIRKPKRILALGTYTGNTLAWNIGPGIGPGKIYSPEQIIGVEIVPESAKTAQDNYRKINVENVTLLCEDGLNTIEREDGPFDYVYLDAENEEIGKGLYLEMLKKVRPKLTPGAWILAHDATDPDNTEILKPYLQYVRNPKNFKTSILFDIDLYGLELTIL